MNDFTLPLPSPNGKKSVPESTLAMLKKHEFKPGQSGNPGGRPKRIKKSYDRFLDETDAKTGLTGAEKIAQKIIQVAQSDSRNNVAAAREVTRVTEGEDEVTQGNISIGAINLGVLAMMQRLVDK
jgi:hypothetical protein